MTKPIFFIAGAQRSGTTYLYNILDQHPEICMASPARPEPKFFMRGEEYEKGVDYYLNKYYYPDGRTRILGEKSTSYIESTEAATRIRTSFPDAKIIFILRDPVMRAISNYYFSVSNGLEKRTLTEVFLEKKPAESTFSTSVSPFKYVERGEYLRYLKTYYGMFGTHQIKVLIFEEMIGGDDFPQNVFRFLGVDSFFQPAGLDEIANANEEDYQVDSIITDTLRKHFQPHIEDLEKFLLIDLSRWKSGG